LIFGAKYLNFGATYLNFGGTFGKRTFFSFLWCWGTSSGRFRPRCWEKISAYPLHLNWPQRRRLGPNMATPIADGVVSIVDDNEDVPGTKCVGRILVCRGVDCAGAP